MPAGAAVGLPVVVRRPNPTEILKVNQSDLSKKAVIAYINKEMHADAYFTEREIDQLYDLSFECVNNSLSQTELITKINNLRGGTYVNLTVALVLVAAMVIVVTIDEDFVDGFQPNLQWVYGDQRLGNSFPYGNVELTQSAGSDKENPSSDPYNYIDIMDRLNKQRGKRSVEMQIEDQFYRIKNPYRDGAKELQYMIAEKMYDSIRECDTDICDIAANLGFKADNIKNVKDHVFYNEHDLDRYVDTEIEHKRFDPNLRQALAWKRLETGIHTLDDIEWIKHECAERHHELKYGSGYTEAHDRAQSRYDGNPWALWEDKDIF